MDLLDAHYRSVVRGFVMDDLVFPESSPLEALAPYLANGKADGERRFAGGTRCGRR